MELNRKTRVYEKVLIFFYFVNKIILFSSSVYCIQCNTVFFKLYNSFKLDLSILFDIFFYKKDFF